jgi:hypothetical protein
MKNKKDLFSRKNRSIFVPALMSFSIILSFLSCGSVSSLVNTAYAVKGNTDSSFAGSSKKASKLPDVFKEPSDKFNDPQMSMTKIKAAISQYCTVYKIVVYGKGPDWEVRRNNFGAIERKISKREIYFTYKYSDGKYYYNSCYFERQYEGGEKYSDPVVVFMTQTEIDEKLAVK